MRLLDESKAESFKEQRLRRLLHTYSLISSPQTELGQGPLAMRSYGC
jgi:hypothetical protein